MAGRLLAVLAPATVLALAGFPPQAQDDPAGRVSLANLNEADYAKIGRAARELIESYYEQFKSAK